MSDSAGAFCVVQVGAKVTVVTRTRSPTLAAETSVVERPLEPLRATCVSGGTAKVTLRTLT